MGGLQGWSGWAENFVATGIQSQTIQPVVGHYTDWATQPTQDGSRPNELLVSVSVADEKRPK
jgi:hypothetical protein